MGVRVLMGLAVGGVVGCAVTYIFQDSGPGICTGCLVALTIVFPVGAPRRRRG